MKGEFNFSGLLFKICHQNSNPLNSSSIKGVLGNNSDGTKIEKKIKWMLIQFFKYF